MRRAILAVFFLAVLAVSASAAIYSQNIFDESITSSGTYTGSNGDKFTITLIGDKISVDFAGGSLIVRNDTCEAYKLYEVCLSITEFDHYDYNYSEGEKIVTKRAVKIYTFLAELNLSREIDKTEFWIGESAEVKMRIQNMGQRATDVSFTDEFSDIFEVALPLVCNLKNNTVQWKGQLESSGVMNCDYRIKAVKPGTFGSVAKADYDTGVGAKTETDTASLTVKDFPLKVEVNLSNETVNLGDTLTATFDLTATENLKLDYLRILLPEGLKLLSQNGIEWGDDKMLSYTAKRDFSGNTTDSFSISLMAVRTGIQAITKTALFNIIFGNDMVSQKLSQDIEVNVSKEEAYARITSTNFTTGDNTLSIFIVNPTKRDFYNAEISIDTELPLDTSSSKFEKISLLGHQEFAAGFNAPSGSYPVTIELRYNSEYGEHFTVKKTENVTVAAGEAEPKAEDNAEAEKAQEAAQELQRRYGEIQKSKFSTSAVIVASIIVVLIAGVLLLISRSKKKKELENPEF